MPRSVTGVGEHRRLRIGKLQSFTQGQSGTHRLRGGETLTGGQVDCSYLQHRQIVWTKPCAVSRPQLSQYKALPDGQICPSSRISLRDVVNVPGG